MPEGLLDKTRVQGNAAVIVQLNVPAGADDHAIRAAQDGLLGELASVHHRVNRRYATIPFIALEVSEAALRVVAASHWTVGITEDLTFTPNPAAPR